MKISIVFWLLVFNQLSFSCKPDIVVSQDTNRNRSFMPLEVQNGRLMVTINFEDSVPAKILIDNGASNVLLDSSFVNNHKELNIQFLSKVMLNLKYPMGVVRTKISSSELSMLLANDTFKTSHIWVNDIRSWFYEDTISGIIPLHVFYKEDSYLNLDLFDKKVYYTDSIDTTQYIKLPFVLNKSGAFCVNLEMDIEVDGMSNHIEGIFLLDLGYPRKDILINPTFFSKIDAENHEDLYYYEIGKQKPRIEYSFKAQKITFTTLNNVIYNNIKLTEYPRFIENYLYEPYAGVIGVEIFENYKIAIDYASKFLYLKPCLEKNTILEETSYKKWGITLRPEKTYDTKKPSSKNWVVSRIKKNGIAWEEGINLSDELLYIDNQPKQNFEQDFLVLKILNQSNTITIKKGNSSIVVLK